MVIVTAIISTVFIGITVLVSIRGTSTGYQVAAALAGVFVLFACWIPHPLLALNLFVVLCIAVDFACRPRPVRWYLLSVFSATALLHGAGLAAAIPYVLEGRRLRAQYPLVSLVDRLAYENKPIGHADRPADTGSAAANATTAGLAAEVRLFEHELSSRAMDGLERTLTLKEVHSSYVAQFIAAPGFGAGRQIRPDRKHIHLDASQPISLPPRAYEDPALHLDPKPLSGADAQGGPANKQAYWARELHLDASLSFVNGDGFGYLVDRAHVAGFQAHQFSYKPAFNGDVPGPKQVWDVEALDLVSLLKHPEPVAYVSENLPRMEDLRHAPVRPLDAFEAKALEALRRGEDIQIYARPDFIRMLGPVLCVKQCASCHNVERGELLGAFSYRLRVIKERQ